MRPTTDRVREALFNILGPAIEGAVFVDVCAGTGAVGIEALSRGAAEAIFIEQHAPAVALIRQNLRSLGLQETRRAAGETVRMPDKEAGKVRTLPVKTEPVESGSGAAPAAGREPRIEVFSLDAVKALEKLHARQFVADFIFLDPPYDAAPAYDQALEAISELRLLRRSGRVIVESQRTRVLVPRERRRVPRMPGAGGQSNRAPWSPPQRIGNLELARTVRHGDTLLSFYRLALAA